MIKQATVIQQGSMSGRSSIVVDSEMGVTTNAEPGIKEAVGSFVVEIGITKVDAGNKEGNKEAAGCSFIGEIDVTKAEVGAAGKGVVTEAAWIEFVFPRPPVELLERKAEPTGALITKEMVPDVIINRIQKKRPFKSIWALFDRKPQTEPNRTEPNRIVG